MFNPTPVGRILVELWLAAVWDDSVVKERMWNLTASFDFRHLIESVIQTGPGFSAKQYKAGYEQY